MSERLVKDRYMIRSYPTGRVLHPVTGEWVKVDDPSLPVEHVKAWERWNARAKGYIYSAMNPV